ncbi:unnamed protein product [Rotaria sp. Silwood1]|nr:unnamed protein product [Rotaria sp. Silwood1]
MTSVERVLDYCSLDQEPSAQVPSDFRPPPSWPSHGEIVFNNVSMRHSTQTYLPLDLHHISMTIRASEKVGIVGRTGAGKSSLIQTLFRMGTLVDGQIKIDNIDIASVGLDDVRRRISIVPQDSVIFTGTMRSNLDPFTDYSDEEIWHALEQLAYFKLHGHKHAPTDEIASTRRFYRGRTETSRTCIPEVVAWCRAMINSNSQLTVKFIFLLIGGSGNFIPSVSCIGFTITVGGTAPICFNGYGVFYRLGSDA